VPNLQTEIIIVVVLRALEGVATNLKPNHFCFSNSFLTEKLINSQGIRNYLVMKNGE
jgi:hypothetical protein